MAASPSLFDRQLLIVSGKGGVGRTTVAAALAVAARRAGKRVLLAQMDSPDRLSRLLGLARPVGPDVVSVSPGLDALNMTPTSALHQYGLMVLRYETLYRALFDNKAVRGFLAAVPGLDAYAMLGKAWWHTTEAGPRGETHRYDLVILDGPASGHVTTLLKIPRAILDALPKGPLSKDAQAMQTMFTDPRRSAFVIVTLAEDLPARETVDLARHVRDILLLPLGPLVVNGLPSPRFALPDLGEVLRRALPPTGDGDLDRALRGAALLAQRRTHAAEVLARLRVDPGLPCIELPCLPTTDLGPPEVAQLAEILYPRIASS